MIFRTGNENVVEASEDIEIIEDAIAETYILRFKNVKLGDEGYYKVTAKNHLGEDSSEGRVRVISKLNIYYIQFYYIRKIPKLDSYF